MTNLAPVVLFTYKRFSVTRKVIDSLLGNEEADRTELIVYSDGPRTARILLRLRAFDIT